MNTRAALGGLLSLCALAAVARAAATPADTTTPQRLVHRFLRVEISPNAAFVASVEGDSPVGAYYPPVRDLIIRRIGDGSAVRVELPCGRVPQCWPGSPTWSPDSSRLSFTLRIPGSHARSVYAVAPDGGGLVKSLDFNGTIEELRYGPSGALAMLATAHAAKEIGATEAGTAVAGDLAEPSPAQRIAILDQGSLRFASPPDLFVYEYDWRPNREGFVGTASPGNGDDNWWTAKLYAFSENGSNARVLYSPANARQQLATPKVSRDGRTVAFIAGLMSDFGSTGGDVYTIAVAGGAAIDATPDMRASATALAWRCDGHLQAQRLAGDQTQFVDLGDARGGTAGRVLWSGSESFGHRVGEVSLACPSGVTATVHESFAAPPEIVTGTVGNWRTLSSANAGYRLATRVRSLSWKSDGLSVQGWLLLPEHGEGKLPMVTIVHGGPAAAAQPAFVGPGLVRSLLERGYAVFLPNPRGSFGQGERFASANALASSHAVKTTTGVFAKVGFALISRRVARPSVSGISRSSNTRSTGFRFKVWRH